MLLKAVQLSVFAESAALQDNQDRFLGWMLTTSISASLIRQRVHINNQAAASCLAQARARAYAQRTAATLWRACSCSNATLLSSHAACCINLQRNMQSGLSNAQHSSHHVTHVRGPRATCTRIRTRIWATQLRVRHAPRCSFEVHDAVDSRSRRLSRRSAELVTPLSPNTSRTTHFAMRSAAASVSSVNEVSARVGMLWLQLKVCSGEREQGSASGQHSGSTRSVSSLHRSASVIRRARRACMRDLARCDS